MNAQNWQVNNTRYLSLSLTWLRLKLERLAQPTSGVLDSAAVTVPNAASAPSVPSSWRQLFTTPPAGQLLTSSSSSVSPSTDKSADIPDPQLAQLEAELELAAQVDPAPALPLLAKQLGLTPFERNILLLCAALDLDARIAGLCARAQNDQTRLYPTFSLALALFDDPSWEALSHDRPLRYWRLIEINQPGAKPLTTSALRADERIVSYLNLNGFTAPDDRLMPFMSPMEFAQDQPVELPPSQAAAAAEVLNHWRRASTEDPLPIVQLLGPDSISKQLVAARAASTVGRQIHRLDADSLPTQFGELETLSRLWHRESLLFPIALYLDAQEVETDSHERVASIQRFLTHSDGVIFLATPESWPRLPRANFSLDIDKPTTAEQREAWAALLETKSAGLARNLSAQFNLNVTSIAEIAGELLNDSELAETEIPERAWSRCRAVSRPRLDALAQRLDPKATWEDLVLPTEQTAQLHQIANQVRQRHTVYEEWGFAEKMNRGFGISVLFAGDSGTGKTMAAEVIANELRLNLYRIDLSAVVSKYIGETEKNLRKLFDAAESGDAILFFDEADALFGKRTEVKDSHDRYANIEINYLLQRMEAYRGLAILATNMIGALDLAFMRRLTAIVRFVLPSIQERKMIWQKVFPRQVPKDNLDYERLGKMNIAGGNIHNIALNAAFMAAQAKSKVTMPIVLSAARTEFRKLDKPINEAEFRL